MRRLLLLAIPLCALAVTATATGRPVANCPTVSSGMLTIGTDNPAYPPWFSGGSPKGSMWKVDDPNNGKGGILNVVNDVGGSSTIANPDVPVTVVSYP